MSALTPIEKYLGLSAGRDPFALLGLTPQRCEQADVLQALTRRLALIDRHPHARSLEAEEVRLALHAAAAQLVDPVVREHLQRAASEGAGAPAGGGAAPRASLPKPVAPPPRPEPAARIADFQDAALRLIRVSGGWNPRAAHRVAALAHAYGLAPREVRAAFHVQRNGATAVAREAVRPPEVERATSPRVRRKRRDARVPILVSLVAVAIGGVFVVGVVALGAALSTTAPSATPEEAPAQTPRTAEAGERAPSEIAERRSADEPVPVTASTLGRVLDEALALRESNPGEAAWRVEQAVRWLRSQWPTMATAARDRATSQVIAFVAAGGPGSAASERVLEAIARTDRREIDAERVTGEVFGAGALALVAGTGGVPDEARALARRLLGTVVDGRATRDTFASGAVAALTMWTSRLTGEDAPPLAISVTEAVWNAWVRASEALGDDAHAARALDAAGMLLREGPSPAEDPGARQALLALLASVDWPSGDGGGQATLAALRLLEWFDDESVATDSLAVVTEWLATSNVSSGVSFAMVLPRSAGPESRRGYRDRFARAWGQAQDAIGDTIAAQWQTAARQAIADRPSGQSPVDAMRVALRMSRLSHAAGLRLARRVPEARLAIVQSDDDVPGATDGAPASGLRAGGPGDDGAWALAFLSAPANATGRLRALERLPDREDPLGMIDAEVLAEAALWASPTEVRTRAAWLLLERAEQLTIVYGVFEALPRAPRTTAASALIESITGRSLPDPESENWRLEARRALVARLLETMAGGSPMGSLDALRDGVTESYRQRAEIAGESAASPLATEFGAGSAALGASRAEAGSALDAATALRMAWAMQARRIVSPLAGVGGPDEIERRRQARMRVAQTAAQRFLAEQAAIVECMAVVAAFEQPQSTPLVNEILGEFATALSQDVKVFQQMQHAEEAQMRLWAVRLGDGSLSEAQTARAAAPVPAEAGP